MSYTRINIYYFVGMKCITIVIFFDVNGKKGNYFPIIIISIQSPSIS